MKIEEYTNKIQEKLGKEEAGKIADDIASILTYDNMVQKDIKSKDEEIVKLKKDKEMLIEANGNLLQKVPFGKEEPKDNPKEEPKNFDFKTYQDNGKTKYMYFDEITSELRALVTIKKVQQKNGGIRLRLHSIQYY